MGPVSTPESIRSKVIPTFSRSPLARAQKQPCALRYSGQIPGWNTKVPAEGSEKIRSFNNVLQRAITISGLASRKKDSASGEFGLWVKSTRLWGETSGKRRNNFANSARSHRASRRL